MKKLLTVMLLLIASTALGGDFEDGMAAHNKGNYAVAMVKFKLAAAQGYAEAQYNIGIMYSEGQGVIQDYAEALNWFKLAAAQGDAAAQYNIGGMYSEGQGVIQDYVEALKWYKLAAAQGEAAAQYNIGICTAKDKV